MQHHIDLWKEKDAKNPKKQLGVQVEGSWYWYEPWVEEVRKHCRENEAIYKPQVPPAQKPKSETSASRPVAKPA